MKFSCGDIVISAPGHRAGCFIITKVDPSRPINCYDGINVITGKSYFLSDKVLFPTKVGTANPEFLSQGDVCAGSESIFERGRRRAEQEARFAKNIGSTTQHYWEYLAKAKPGDAITILRNGRPEPATFKYVNEHGEKYVFVAVNARGTVYKWELSALVLKDVPKRSDDDILNDIRSVHCGLSPENLSADGELSRHQVISRRRQLLTQLQNLEAELGRSPSDSELYPFRGLVP